MKARLITLNLRNNRRCTNRYRRVPARVSFIAYQIMLRETADAQYEAYMDLLPHEPCYGE